MVKVPNPVPPGSVKPPPPPAPPPRRSYCHLCRTYHGRCSDVAVSQTREDEQRSGVARGRAEERVAPVSPSSPSRPLVFVDQDLSLEHGNCWSACMATITGLPIERFARFHELYCAQAIELESGASVSWATRRAYVDELHRMGWHVQRLEYGPLNPIPIGYSIASGLGPRGLYHSCVALDGVIVHDPHPSRQGVERIEYFEVLVPILECLPEGSA